MTKAVYDSGKLTKLYKAAGLRSQGRHALRHTSLTPIYQRSMGMHLIVMVAENGSVETTLIYVHMQLEDVPAVTDTLGD